MAHDHGAVCLCMATHRPAPLEYNWHHVWPKGMGGPDIEGNLLWLCPTTHVNVHELLRWNLREGRIIPWREVTDAYAVPVSRYAYEVAAVGHACVQARSLIPWLERGDLRHAA